MTFTLEIIAVDFDGTLVTDEFPNIGKPNVLVENFIKERKAAGAKIILWTCRTGEYLRKAVEHCNSRKIPLDAINDNIPEIVRLYGGNPRKIYADIYLDDRNMTIGNAHSSKGGECCERS